VKQSVAGWPPIHTALSLALIYFYSMYAFSMLTGHIMAFVVAFMIVANEAAVPPLLMVALLAYFSNLCGCTTHYSSGPLIIYFGLGYVTVPRWFGIGFLVSLAHLVIWLGIGLPYWKLLGWW
jgi:divalent anion:Na+ symporter, DASS family